VARFAANLRTKLGQVYRHFLAQGVTIVVNGRKVDRYDPLMLDNPETEKLLDTEIDLGDGTKAKLVAVELPDLGTSGDAEHNIFPHNSGFYVVRNGREIIAGDTFGFYRHHHSYSHFRAELSYHGDSNVFHEDIKKSSVHPDDRLLGKLRDITEKLIADVGRRSRERATNIDSPRIVHRSAQAAINEKFGLIAGGVTKTVLEKAKEAALNPPAPQPEANGDSPRKRGRPTKEEAERRAAEEKKREEEKAKLPPAPKVEFIEVDAGNDGRFFSFEQKGNVLTIAYNTRHPLIRHVAAANMPRVSGLLDMIAFSLARAETDVPEGKKLVNKACDYLAVLAAPALQGGGA